MAAPTGSRVAGVTVGHGNPSVTKLDCAVLAASSLIQSFHKQVVQVYHGPAPLCWRELGGSGRERDMETKESGESCAELILWSAERCGAEEAGQAPGAHLTLERGLGAGVQVGGGQLDSCWVWAFVILSPAGPRESRGSWRSGHTVGKQHPTSSGWSCCHVRCSH